VLDNPSSHNVSGVRGVIEGRGTTLFFLPPDSPDLNPTGLAFSKLKRLLRGAEERTVEALWQTIGTLLDPFTPKECKKYIRHCGASHVTRNDGPDTVLRSASPGPGAAALATLPPHRKYGASIVALLNRRRRQCLTAARSSLLIVSTTVHQHPTLCIGITLDRAMGSS
jgi:hypothetical protein